MSYPLKIETFANWLATGERGISSEAIVSHLTGVQVGRYNSPFGDHPYDRDDFRRCELLLRSVPLARLHFPLMKTRGAVWAALVEAWDELVELGESEVPGAFDGPQPYGSAPKMYARMREIREAARSAS